MYRFGHWVIPRALTAPSIGRNPRVAVRVSPSACRRPRVAEASAEAQALAEEQVFRER